MANSDFLLKVLEMYFIEILIFWKILNFDKNRDKGNVFKIFFSHLKLKDLATNELEVDFLSYLVIF